MGFNNSLAQNIRKLRETNNVTQEQLAKYLNISYQAISKWENGLTVPNTLMLPQIAHFFDVSIDDLFMGDLSSNGPRNEAEKWLWTYEETNSLEDFVRAESEYSKLSASSKQTPQDELNYAILYYCGTVELRKKTLKLFDDLIAKYKEADTEMFHRAKRQKNVFLKEIGRTKENIVLEEAYFNDHKEREDYFDMVSAYYWGMQFEDAFHVLQEMNEKYQVEDFRRYLWAGDICRELHRYDEAFQYWEKAMNFRLEKDGLDPLFSMAFCYEELKQYEKAADSWKRIVEWDRKRGYLTSSQFVMKNLERVSSLI